MADKKSNLTSYDRRFIASLVFAHFGLVMMAISFFGLYYHNRYTGFKAYMAKMNKKIAILKEI